MEKKKFSDCSEIEIKNAILASTSRSSCLDLLEIPKTTTNFLKLKDFVKTNKIETDNWVKYKNYDDAKIIEAVKNSIGLSSCLRYLGLIEAGGNFIHLKKNLKRLNCDTSHWKGSTWSKGERLKNWEDYTKVSGLKVHLVKLRGNKCEECGISDWNNKPISFETHHIDGDRINNKLENLQILCPNCHSQTENWRRKLMKKKSEDV